MARIVVGVDGSENSAQALRWAVDEARRRDATLEVVMTWEYPALYATASHAVMLPPEDDFAGAAHATVSDLLAEAGGEGVEIIENVVAGPPAPVLIEASKGADLLVVGSRGRGAFKGMLLGSVSQHCVSHATCPVVVVRGATDDA